MSAALPFSGLVVVVTGDAPGMDRDQAKAAVVRLGGKPSGSVSASTGLIVAGKGAGVSKMEKARQLQVPVLDAATFASLAADPAGWDGQPLGAVPAAPAPVRRGPDHLAGHRGGEASGSFEGVWAVRRWCECGWRVQGPRSDTAAARRDHLRQAGAASSEGSAGPSL